MSININYYENDCEILRFSNERKLDFKVATSENIFCFKPIVNANKRVKYML